MSYNLEITQGEDYTRTFTVFDSKNTIVPLTGCSLYAHIRKNHTSTEYVSFTMTIISAAQATASMFLPYTITNTLQGKYVYDIFLIDPFLKHFKIEDGIINITPKITNYP